MAPVWDDDDDPIEWLTRDGPEERAARVASMQKVFQSKLRGTPLPPTYVTFPPKGNPGKKKKGKNAMSVKRPSDDFISFVLEMHDEPKDPWDD